MTVFASDRALLDAFRRGDRGALTTVYFHYIDDLAAVVRHGFTLPASGARVRGAVDDQTARDLLQDIFARAFAPKARLAYDGIRPYGGYLRRIAKNLMIDRARAADPTIPFDDDGELVIAAPADDADEEAAWAAHRRETVAYVATLPAELQRLVQLRFEDEQSQDQTAAALGISRRRVRTLEARIQKGLRLVLRKAGLLQKDRPGAVLRRMGTR